mmetsp:Transcript_2313/g.4280  ORF Transcript_2313/g.4280 Transcript_2313/m.4280 type:complete len:273 (-) Transcript_2313:315-1133(-)
MRRNQSAECLRVLYLHWHIWSQREAGYTRTSQTDAIVTLRRTPTLKSGYPNAAACLVALSAVRKWLETGNNRQHVDRVVFVTFLDVDVALYNNLTRYFFPMESCDVVQDEKAKLAQQNNELYSQVLRRKAEFKAQLQHLQKQMEVKHQQGVPQSPQQKAALHQVEAQLLKIEEILASYSGNGGDSETKEKGETDLTESTTPDQTSQLSTSSSSSSSESVGSSIYGTTSDVPSSLDCSNQPDQSEADATTVKLEALSLEQKEVQLQENMQQSM